MLSEKRYFEDPSVLHVGMEESHSYFIPFAPPYVPRENPTGVYSRTFDPGLWEGMRYYLNFELHTLFPFFHRAAVPAI